ncbi:MAG: phage holin family protein [Lawsonibacter sp.]|nr:phage holin family protein [Lawsonibacter sp.]
MDEKANHLKAAIAAGVGVLTGLWGWLGWLVVLWVALMALDYITGSAAACRKGDWASWRAREGIWHKAGMVTVVIVAAGADLLISLVLANLPVLALPVRYPGLVGPVVLVWYIVTELGSVTENAVMMGAPVPAWLTRLLAAGKAAMDKAGDALTVEEEER